MSRAKITALMQEIDTLASEAEYLHELLTTEVGKHWLGEAQEACLRESGDNREAALQAMQNPGGSNGEVSNHGNKGSCAGRQ